MSDLRLDEGIDVGNEPEINVKKYLIKLVRRWPYILLFFIASILVGVAINRYTTPVYMVKARITTKKYNDKQASPIPGLVDASFFISSLIESYEEIPILKSPKRIAAAIDKLDFEVSYFSKGLVKTLESEKGNGFIVQIDSMPNDQYPYNVPIFVNHLDEKTFELKIENRKDWEKVVDEKSFRFGVPFQLGTATITVTNTNGRTAERNKYFFVLNRKADLVNEYSSKLRVDWSMKGSAMLDLQILSELPERDLKFMQAYYQVVEEMGLAEKNETLDNTIGFIDEQMKLVTDSLNFYQSLANEIRLDNRKLPVGVEGVFTKLNDLDNQRAQVLLAEQYFDYLIDYFKSNRQAEVFAPSLIGLQVPLVEKWVNDYIQKKLTEKKSIVTQLNSQNPLILRMDSVDVRLEKSIYEAIRSTRIFNAQKLKEIDKQYGLIYYSIDGMQEDNRELNQHQRLYQINNSLFDLFIRRKAEAAISKASATSDYKVIDAPAYSKVPISPNKENNLLIASVLGFILPVAFSLIRDLTNSRIMDKDDLQKYLHIPMLGNIAHSSYETKMVVRDHPRSVVAESFRAIRANLKFLATNIPTKAHTFIITSSIGGEGKTFCCLNMATALAYSQKKTIVVGADLRKPELGRYFDVNADNGLSAYLAGYVDIKEIIVVGSENEPDFIDAGKIPPNPSELLGNVRMGELMAYLKTAYDYIIIDTPPIGLVSDAMELFKYSDYNVLIVRHSVTPKTALKMIDELYLDGKLRNFTTLFNDLELIKRKNSYYGGYLYGMGYSGYGYGYYEEDQDKEKKRKKKS